jgi:hypothetical protein
MSTNDREPRTITALYAELADQKPKLARLALLEEMLRNGSLIIAPDLYNPEVEI